MMFRVTIVFLMLTSAASPVVAAEIISVGNSAGFVGPHPPYDSAAVNLWSISLGYGQPENTIGDEVWFSETGVYDLSEEPDLPGFITMATNGVVDDMEITVKDEDHYSETYHFIPTDVEVMWLGTFPDLVGYVISGAQLRVLDIAYGGASQNYPAAVSVQWEFLGVPEPASLLLMLVAGVVLQGRIRQA
jgi:hypothetical protein